MIFAAHSTDLPHMICTHLAFTAVPDGAIFDEDAIAADIEHIVQISMN